MNDNLLRRLEAEKTGVRFPRVHTGATIAQLSQECTDLEPMGLGMKSEYRLKCDLGVNFVCNEAQYDEVKKQARQQLQREIYGPLLSLADKAMMAVMTDDPDAARIALNKLIGICVGSGYGD